MSFSKLFDTFSKMFFGFINNFFGIDIRKENRRNVIDVQAFNISTRACYQTLRYIKALGRTGAKISRNHDVFHFRSEEHTSELQSRPHLVCRLLLEKKNT